MPLCVINAMPLSVVEDIRDRCLCFATQRAARRLARRFDKAFLPIGLTNQQFSLMTALSAPLPWRIGDLAEFLAMDRTSLTANLKALERRGFAEIAPGAQDKRIHRPILTDAGRAALAAAEPIWRAEHVGVEAGLAQSDIGALRAGLAALA